MQETSINARNLKRHDIASEKEEVFTFIALSGQVCDQDIAHSLNMLISTVTARRNELYKDKKIEVACKKYSTHSGVKVLYWQVRQRKNVVEERVEHQKIEVADRSFAQSCLKDTFARIYGGQA